MIGADVATRDHLGRNALHHAAAAGHAGAVAAALRASCGGGGGGAAAAPWTQLDYQGRTPQAVATTVQVVELLQRHCLMGADVR